jgi:PAS domain S-box-containing protein
MRRARFGGLHRQKQQQRAVAEFALRVLTTRGRTQLLNDAVETAARGLEAEYADLLELQPDQTTLILRAGYGVPDGIEGTALPIEAEAPAARALRERKPILVEDWAQISQGSFGDVLRDRRVASSATMAMAILVDDEPYGVLEAHSTHARAFRQGDLSFLRSLANAVASAIAREQSLESARRLAAIVESSLDAIVGRTLDGTVTSWNAAAERLFGYSAGEMIGRSIAILAPSDRKDEFVAIRERLDRGEVVEQFETVRVRKDGALLDVASTISPIVDEAGRIVGASAISRDITDGKRAEAALRDSEASIRAVLDSALDAVITIDREGAVLEFSPSAERMFGLDRAAVLGKSLAEVIIPVRLRAEHRRGLAHYLETGEGPILGKRIELWALRGDGSEFPVEVAINRVSLGGDPVFTGFVRDISERSRTERALRQLAAIVESSEDAIIGKTLDGTITSWNAGAERTYGYRADEMIGESVGLLVPPERPDELTEILELLRHGERIRHLETVRLRKDGARVQVALTISPIIDEAGSIVGASTIARDVTEREQAEADRRKSEERYRELFENATDLIAVTDIESRLTRVNKAFAHTLGYKEEELIGKPLLELVPPEWHDRLQAAQISKLSEESASTVYQHELLAKDGRLIRVEVSSRLIEEEGRPVGTEAICRDITERQQLEEQLRQSQRVESVGRLAGGIAHDFNNLLTVIAGYTEALLDRKDPVDEPELTEIAAAAERAAILTHQLLAFSRRQVLQPTVLNLNQVVADITQMLERLLGERIEIVSSLDATIAPVLADVNQLEQVIVNLAVNARDAMPDGGTLTIETGSVELDHEYVVKHREATVGRHSMLAVSDTGTGMDAATMANLFEPFFTTKPVGIGTGLGLATVYGIVKQSGGNIWVYSEPGRGTTFKVYLPVSEAPLTPAQSSDRVAIPTGNETILIVEDEQALRDLVVQMLATRGYRAIAAETVQHAVELIDNDELSIDLLLTDLVMPGTNGRELAEQVRARRPDVRVLFMSGYADAAVLSTGTLEPGSAFVEKPFSANELAHKVREVLDG